MSTSFAASSRSYYVDRRRTPISVAPTTRSLFDSKRFQKLQILVAEMRHPISGVVLRDRHRKGRFFPNTFRGSDAINWFLAHYRDIVNIRTQREENERHLYHTFAHQHGPGRNHNHSHNHSHAAHSSFSSHEKQHQEKTHPRRSGSSVQLGASHEESPDSRSSSSSLSVSQSRSPSPAAYTLLDSHTQSSLTDRTERSASIRGRLQRSSHRRTHSTVSTRDLASARRSIDTFQLHEGSSLPRMSSSHDLRSAAMMDGRISPVLTSDGTSTSLSTIDLQRRRYEQVMRQRRSEGLLLAQELLDRGYIITCDATEHESLLPYRDSKRTLYQFSRHPPTLAEDQVDELVERMTDPVDGVPHADRIHRYTRCHYCFVGSEAVDWLLTKIHLPNVGYREHATALMQNLLERGLLLPSFQVDAQRFEDSSECFYSFILKVGPRSFVTNDHLYEMVTAMRKLETHGGLAIRDRRSFFSSYPKSFIGSEAVTWMCRYLDLFSRHEALVVGQELLRRGLICNVSNAENGFIDGPPFYRFMDTGSCAGYMTEVRHSNDRPSRLLWFVLRGKVLYAHKTHSTTSHLYLIELETAAVCPYSGSADQAPQYACDLPLESICMFELRTAEQRYTLSCRSTSELDTWMLKLCAVTTQISLENEFLDQAEAMITGATYHRAHLEEQELIRKLGEAELVASSSSSTSSSEETASTSSPSHTGGAVDTAKLPPQLAGSVDLTPYRPRSASLIQPPRPLLSSLQATTSPNQCTRAQCEEMARAAATAQTVKE